MIKEGKTVEEARSLLMEYLSSFGLVIEKGKEKEKGNTKLSGISLKNDEK